MQASSRGRAIVSSASCPFLPIRCSLKTPTMLTGRQSTRCGYASILAPMPGPGAGRSSRCCARSRACCPSPSLAISRHSGAITGDNLSVDCVLGCFIRPPGIPCPMPYGWLSVLPRRRTSLPLRYPASLILSRAGVASTGVLPAAQPDAVSGRRARRSLAGHATFLRPARRAYPSVLCRAPYRTGQAAYRLGQASRAGGAGHPGGPAYPSTADQDQYMTQRKRAVVIGAGFGGLALAIRLQAGGYQV